MAAFNGAPHTQIQQFDCELEPASNASRWEKWLARFENYLIAVNIDKDERKKAMLLHFVGEKVYDIYDTLSAADDKYADVKQKLNDYFKPMKDTAMAVFLFREEAQKIGETIDQFQTRLRGMSKHCEFENADKEIRSQILQKTNNKTLRREILKHPQWKLEDVLKEARSLEASETQAVDMEERGHSGINHVNRHSGKKPLYHKKKDTKPKLSQNNTKCNNCGGNWPHNGGKQKCPANGKKCNSCGKLNHFSKVCRSKQQPSKKVHNVEHEQNSKTSDNDDYVFSLTTLFTSNNVSDTDQSLPYAHIKVEDKQIKFLIDSGSSVDIINSKTYQMLGKPHLADTKHRIFAYNAEQPLNTIGKFKARLTVENKSANAQLTVVDSDTAGNLLSYETAKNLNILHIKSICNLVQSQPVTQNNTDDYVNKHPELFTGVGKLKDYQAKIHVDDSIEPVAQPHRRVPFHMRKRVEDEIHRLKSLDIIEEINGPTPWISPATYVNRKSGEIRLCVDMRRANSAIKRERYPGPTLHDLVAELNGSKVFSVIDMREGFHQIELEEDSRDITTFSTHIGNYRFKRLIYGISCAPELFQKVIEQTIHGIPGVKNIAADIIIHGVDQESHGQSLSLLFKRLKEKGITLRPEKCKFNQSQITFFGYTWSSQGLSPDPKKVEAVAKLDPPTDPGQVRSILGMTNYCSRFIPKYSDITAPLRELTRDGTTWHWDTEQNEAFDKLKQILMAKPTLSYFDPQRQTEILTDASPVGLSAILTQRDDNDKIHTVAYASRALSPVEQRYPQTDREALAVVWACEHFHLYLYGKPVIVFTDHKALTYIYNNPKLKTTIRLEKYAHRLAAYDATVKYKPGAQNPADYMSRNPLKLSNTSDDGIDRYINFVAENSVPKAMYLEEIKCATLEDPVLQEVAKRIRSNQWHIPAPPDIDSNMFERYKQVRNELTVLNDNDLILRGTKIIIPSVLQTRVLAIAHEGHLGLVKTKQLLREKVWFPYIDYKAETLIKNCLACQASIKEKTKGVELSMSNLPRGPWEEICVDFWGPTPDGTYAVVFIDEYSRYPIVEYMKSVSAESVIPIFDKVFSTFGIPFVCKTDNGPPFTSGKFASFCDYVGCKHRKITPLWPQANAEAERFMKNLKKIGMTSKIEGKNWKQETFKYLRNYRSAPHGTTQVCPATVIFNHRPVRIKIPSVYDMLPAIYDQDQQVRVNDQLYKGKTTDKSKFNRGDKVLVKIKRQNKFTPEYDPKWYRVINIKGSMITARRADHTITRNSSFFKKYYGNQEYSINDSELRDHVHVPRDSNVQSGTPMPNPKQTVPTMPKPVTPTATGPACNSEPELPEIPPNDNSTPLQAEHTDNPVGMKRNLLNEFEQVKARPVRNKTKPAWLSDFQTY